MGGENTPLPLIYTQMNKQVTPVEYLEEQRKWAVITNEDIDKAKKLEKERIEAAYRAGYTDCSLDRFSDCEEYYNKNFNNTQS